MPGVASASSNGNLVVGLAIRSVVATKLLAEVEFVSGTSSQRSDRFWVASSAKRAVLVILSKAQELTIILAEVESLAFTAAEERLHVLDFFFLKHLLVILPAKVKNIDSLRRQTLINCLQNFPPSVFICLLR